MNVDLVFDEIVKRERERERERESEREFSTNNVWLRGASTVVPVQIKVRSVLLSLDTYHSYYCLLK